MRFVASAVKDSILIDLPFVSIFQYLLVKNIINFIDKYYYYCVIKLNIININ